jgi:GTP-binding protein
VDDVPGVTRDRVVARAEYGGRVFRCVDTGGFEAGTPRDVAGTTARVRAQTLRAVAEADVIVCVLDGVAGLTPPDRETVRLLERSPRPVLYAVNKIDHPGREDLLHDFHAAGVERLFPISAAHRRGIEPLLDAVVAALPAAAGAAAAGEGTRLALVGRPNVGKSSLLNRLLGEERVVVAPEAGTTRDAVDTPVVVDGTPYELIDTAGIRRRGRVRDALERHGAVRALGTLDRTDLALVVFDAAEGLTDQDARIVGRAWEAGRGVILVANKWDTVPRERRDRQTFQRALATRFAAFANLPLVCVSAVTGEGLDALWPLVGRVARSYAAALPTPALNRALARAVETTPPPSPGGRAIRLLYATQTAARPPTVTVFASAPRLVPTAYVRYLTARLAEAFRLVGVPLRLQLRSRRPEEVSGRPASGTRALARRRSRPTGAAARPRPR